MKRRPPPAVAISQGHRRCGRWAIYQRRRARPPTAPFPATRNLSKTCYKVGIFSLSGQAALEKPNNFDAAAPIIERALDSGVIYIDTSSTYGGPERWSEDELLRVSAVVPTVYVTMLDRPLVLRNVVSRSTTFTGNIRDCRRATHAFDHWAGRSPWTFTIRVAVVTRSGRAAKS